MEPNAGPDSRGVFNASRIAASTLSSPSGLGTLRSLGSNAVMSRILTCCGMGTVGLGYTGI
jgi:hypothetical protein